MKVFLRSFYHCSLIAVAAVCFCFFSALPALAEGTPVATGSNTISLSITAGLLTGTIGSASAVSSITLDGSDKTATYTIPVTVSDYTGSGDGWNLTITSTTFTTGGDSPQTLAANTSRVTSVSNPGCATDVTCVNPVNTITYPVVIPAGATAPDPAKFFSAQAGTGIGGPFVITPTVTIAIPATVRVGSYSSTVTIALVSGP